MVLVIRCYSTGSNLHFNIAVNKMCNVRKRNTEAQSRLLQWKTVSITYSECVSVALICQLSKCLCRIMVSSVACPTLPHFFTLSHKRHDFRKKNMENVMSVLMFSKTIAWNVFHSKNNSAKHYHKFRVARKEADIFVRF